MRTVTYVGEPDSEAWRHIGAVYVESSKGRAELFNDATHSPTGFGWGYSGSGPTQLARAILSDHLDYVPESVAYIAFRDEVIARLPRGRWRLTSAEIRAWIDKFLKSTSRGAIPRLKDWIIIRREGA